MARIKGQANYASNFEVLKQAPLDSRTVVSDAGDLTKIATWQDADGNVWLYDGLIVVVPNADNANAPEVYVLKDKDNYGRPDAWLKLGADNDISQLKELNVVYPNNIRSLTTESTVAEVMEAFVPAIGGSAGEINTPHVGYLIKGGDLGASSGYGPDSTIISVEIVKIDNKDCHKFMYIDNNRDLVTMTVYLAGIADCKVIERSVVSNIDTIINNINTFDDFYTRMTDFVVGDNDNTALLRIETTQQNSIGLNYKTLDTVNGSKTTQRKIIPAVNPASGLAGAAGMNLVHDIPYFLIFINPALHPCLKVRI